MTGYRDLLPIIVETSGAQMPEGFDSWGLKSVRPGLETTYGFHWAPPGGLNVSNDNLNRWNRGARPRRPGDGLCVATSWRGMASGGIPARTLLLVAYREEDVVGRDIIQGKLRIGGAVATVALVDGERFIREHGRGADLREADFSGADLSGADLREADLRGAELYGADLSGADLRGATLQGADLMGADLHSADLQGANLQGADLRGVNLQGADLEGANLRSADLQGADLRGANLHGTDLWNADLKGAKLPDNQKGNTP